MVEAFPFETAPRFLVRDRDGFYGQTFRRRVRSLGIDEMITAPRSPWQKPYAERLIETLGRERLDHVIVLHDRHLRRTLRSHIEFYHRWRIHQSLEIDALDARLIQPPELGKVVGFADVGGLRCHYERRAAWSTASDRGRSSPRVSQYGSRLMSVCRPESHAPLRGAVHAQVELPVTRISPCRALFSGGGSFRGGTAWTIGPSARPR